jgi:hypothetical protein
LWLWETGRRLGITGDEEMALRAAAANLTAGDVARVEQARLALDNRLMPVYERTGVGQIGRLVAGRVFWDAIQTAPRS